MKRLAASLVPFAIVACAMSCSSNPPPSTEPTTTVTATATAPEPEAKKRTPEESCVAMIEKGAGCGDGFLEMIIDARAKADMPPGIKEAVEKNRAVVLSLAQEEWKRDSVEPARTAMCKRSLTPFSESEQTGMASDLEGCLAKAECGEFLACMKPVQEKYVEIEKSKLPPIDPAMLETCTQVMAQAEKCIDPFLGMLLDLRAELDFPAGIAAKIKTERKAIMAEGKTELAADLGEKSRKAICETAARGPKTDVFKSASECLKQKACGQFVACMKPVQKAQFEAEKKATGQ